MSCRSSLSVVLATLLLATSASSLTSVTTDHGSLALVGGTVWLAGDAEPLENAMVIVRNGLVEAVGTDLPLPADAQAIDVRGLNLSAAFVDASHHGLVTFADHQVMQGRPIDDGRDTLAAMVDGNRRGLAPNREARLALTSADTDLSDHRKAGFGALMVAPDQMLLAGQGVWLLPSGLPAREAMLGGTSAQFGALTWRGSPGNYSGTAYPATLMGVMAHLRQFFLDAQHQGLIAERFADGRSARRPLQDPGLDAILPVLEGRQQLALRADAEEDIRLALQLAQTFGGIDLVIVGGREAWELKDELLAQNVGVVLDLDFPDEPENPFDDDVETNVDTEDDDETGSEDSDGEESDGSDLPERLEDGSWPAPQAYDSSDPDRLLGERHDSWIERVSCAARLIEAGVPVAFGSFDGDAAELLAGVATAIEHGGLERADAIAALTTAPNLLFGGAAPRGELVPGSLASLTAWEGEPMDEDAEVRLVIVDGQLFDLRSTSERYTPPEAEDDEDAAGAPAGDEDEDEGEGATGDEDEQSADSSDAGDAAALDLTDEPHKESTDLSEGEESD
ncbi:MAG: imidazolonepropionase-like amidohydrolase, partial [Pseudohongiellaceae bacterium]